MFQLTKGELEILRSQIVISKMPDNQVDENWKSQNATSNFVRMGLRKTPYAFTENGVAMLSSVLRSPLAIQVNISIALAVLGFAACYQRDARTSGRTSSTAQTKANRIHSDQGRR